MRYLEISRKLRTLGCIEVARRSGGSHRKWLNSTLGKSTTVPDWGNKDLKLGTLRAIVRQLGLAWQEFEQA